MLAARARAAAEGRRSDDRGADHASATSDPILAHRRGHISGSPASVIANWDKVFQTARDVLSPSKSTATRAPGSGMAHAGEALASSYLFARQRSTHNQRLLSYPSPHWRTHGSPPFPSTDASTAGRWTDCWPGCRIHPPSPAIECAGSGLSNRDGRLVDSARRGVTLRGRLERSFSATRAGSTAQKSTRRSTGHTPPQPTRSGAIAPLQASDSRSRCRRADYVTN